MNNSISFKFSLKKIYNVNILLFVFINIFILTSFYKFYIDQNFNKNNEILKSELTSQLTFIEDNINNHDIIENRYNDISSYFVKIKDSNNDVLYTNYKKNTYLNEYDSILVINNNTYYVSLAMTNGSGLITLILYMVLIETLVIFIYLIATTLIVNKNLLTPVDKLVNDMKNYKYGIKPTKRVTTTRIDLIQNEFVNLVDSLEQNKEEQNRIIASISHDIKTPLTSLIGYTSRLETANLTEEKRNEYIKKIYNKSLDMKDLISTFDDYISVNLKTTIKTSILVKDLLNKIYDDYYIDLEDKNIKFIIKTKCKNEIINIDLNKIKRVFSNIISNSVRYLDKDNKLIIITTKRLKQEILITVSDNGKGVDNDLLDKIFEPLYTSDPSRKISGLGLSICKEIIESHSGSIRAYNNKKGGLSIEMRLPLENR